MPLPQTADQFHVQARRKTDARDLQNYLNQFQQDNSDSGDVEHRWLAQYADDLMKMAFHVKAGNHDTIRKQVNDFRLSEIEAAKNKLQMESDGLTIEENKILREIEQSELAKPL